MTANHFLILKGRNEKLIELGMEFIVEKNELNIEHMTNLAKLYLI